MAKVYTKTCKYCGKEFTSTSPRASYCEGPHYKKCEVCGKEFEVNRTQINNGTSVCSEECRVARIRNTRNSKWSLFTQNPESYIASNFTEIPSRKELLTELSIDISTLNAFIEKHNLGNIVREVERKCKCCGEVFIPRRSDQLFCGNVHVVKCEICGKEFERKCESGFRHTCSDECNIEYIKLKQQESSYRETRTCKFCGKEFHPKSSRQIYCDGPHYGICVICGKEYEIPDVTQTDYAKTCSKECRDELTRRNTDYSVIAEHVRDTMREKYGVDNAMDLSDSREKIANTQKDRYGGWYSRTDEYKERVKETSLEKYGVEHHLQAEGVIAKRTETVQKKYGVDNVFQSDEIKEIIKNTLQERYGVSNPLQNPDAVNKSKKTSIERYGADHYCKTDEFKKQMVSSNRERFGADYYTQTRESLLSTMSDPSKVDIYLEFREDPIRFLSNLDHDITLHTLENALGVTQSQIGDFIRKNNLCEYISYHKSSMETEVIQVLTSICPEIKIVRCDRTSIRPYELDIYLPEYKIAIECNPTATHNSSFSDPWGGDPKPSTYHRMKSRMCKQNGIFLFHIFGHEWNNNRDVIDSLVRNLLGKNENKIYARKCEVREVAHVDALKFLNENHRQGYAGSSTRLGLYYNDNLVSLMTFGKMRRTIGTGNEDLSDCMELIRFCNLKNTSIVGGASKLFKYFVQNHNPRRIRSFSDIAHTRGTLYYNLGFAVVRESDPGYVWVDLKTDVAYNRVRAQKHNLKKFLNDESIDMRKSETQLMEEHGFAKVYDCGTVLWEWTNYT